MAQNGGYMSKGIVYILTNPSLQNWVKIGYSDKNDIQSRLNSLNASSAIPLSFRVYATLCVENAKEIEQSIHSLLDAIDPSLHSIEKLESGKERIREIFQISPEKAYLVFKEVSKLKSCEGDLKLNKPNEVEQEEEEIVNIRRGRITFKELKIKIGSELIFINDNNTKCITVNEKNTVVYNTRETTLSGLAEEKLGYRANGFKYFIFENETLWDRRIRLESSQENNV